MHVLGHVKAGTGGTALVFVAVGIARTIIVPARVLEQGYFVGVDTPMHSVHHFVAHRVGTTLSLVVWVVARGGGGGMTRFPFHNAGGWRQRIDPLTTAPCAFLRTRMAKFGLIQDSRTRVGIESIGTTIDFFLAVVVVIRRRRRRRP